MKKILFILLGIILFVSCTDTKEEPEVMSEVNKEQLLYLVNLYRAAGCNCGQYGDFPPVDPLVWNDTLQLAAWDHSRDMNKKNFFDHIGSDGSNPGTRMTKRGYIWKAAGENIAKGTFTDNVLIHGWISSAGHCVNIMDPNFKEMGISQVGNYWTQVFGAR